MILNNQDGIRISNEGEQDTLKPKCLKNLLWPKLSYCNSRLTQRQPCFLSKRFIKAYIYVCVCVCVFIPSFFGELHQTLKLQLSYANTLR